jgi:uncharacterized protein
MRRRIFILSVLAFLCFLVVLKSSLGGKFPLLSYPSPQDSNLKHSTLIINQKTISVEIANTEATRSLGLSGRKSLMPDEGMLFIWEYEVYPIFWMKDMHFPLDVIWINNNKVIAVIENMQPEPGKKDNELTLYPETKAVTMALEVNAGYVQKNNIEVGDSVTLE